MGSKRLQKIIIPFDQADMLDPASRTPFMAQTEKAYGFRVNGQMIWIPKSQIEDFEYRADFNANNPNPDGRADNFISFSCPEWLIEEKALEYFVDTSHEPTLFDYK